MTEEYIGAMFKNGLPAWAQDNPMVKPPEFGACDLCDKAVESEPVMELSQVRFQHNLCATHFRAAKDDSAKIRTAIEEKRAKEEADAEGYYEQVERERRHADDARRFAEAEKQAEADAFEAEKQRIRETKEFFDG